MHPVESILLDGISVALAFPAARLTVRQGMWFTAIVTFKALCDHAGYEIPRNPVYAFPYANDVNFHNLHHQSWGLKVSVLSFFFFSPRVTHTHTNPLFFSPSLIQIAVVTRITEKEIYIYILGRGEGGLILSPLPRFPQHNFGIYSLFWDWLLGTLWLDQEAAKQKYERYQQMAEDQLSRTKARTGTMNNLVEEEEPTEKAREVGEEMD